MPAPPGLFHYGGRSDNFAATPRPFVEAAGGIRPGGPHRVAVRGRHSARPRHFPAPRSHGTRTPSATPPA